MADLDYIPATYGNGFANAPSSLKTEGGSELKPLTEKQELYMQYYFECDGSPTCIAKKAGFRDRRVAATIGMSTRVKLEIARRAKHEAAHYQKLTTREFKVPKEARLELLWRIAEGGAERITDKEGNMVFMNPAVSVSAIRTINEMLPGSLAPKEVEITHKQDTRTEDEIKASIAKLQEEYQQLVAIDGTSILLKEKDIKKSESLPMVTPEGHVKPRAKVHVPVRPKDE